MAHSSPDDIRDLGWMVACHNDYRLNGEFYTFWLFTRGNQAETHHSPTLEEVHNTT